MSQDNSYLALMESFQGLIGDRNPASSGVRAEILAHLKTVMEDRRTAIREKLEENGRGLECARALASLQDEVVLAIHQLAIDRVYPANNPSAAERLCVAAVGGYGRGAMAPGSDVDLLFLFPYKATPWLENVTEYILYMLWDLGLKVGHGTRTIAECVRMAREDHTIRTALLEARFLVGDRSLFDDFRTQFDKDVVAGTETDFITAKLSERDSRHQRVGSSRYLVEPNVKDGKGGLRDLQTLFWIAKYCYHSGDGAEALVAAGLLSRKENRLFRKCSDFLWAVRCHLHFLTGRAEERVSFDLQPELANRLGYQRHPGQRAVERFMKHYFLVAKDVGDLTRIVCAALEEKETKNSQGLNRFLRGLRRGRKKPMKAPGFVLDGGRINVADDRVFEDDPANLIRIFRLAGAGNHAMHPDAMRLITRSLKRIDKTLRNNPEANRLFLEILTSNDNTEVVLRRMNESGVLGRFIPDFGKVVAMMQFNMYHHFTVDEHLIRAVGVLADMHGGKRGEEHPLSHEILPGIKDLVPLYAALLLHDIAKGRPEDHSIAGAKIARKLCPRFGLDEQQTELTMWLVEQHLTMSIFAQSRDLADRKTILDFAKIVETLDRMKLLLVLTVCDIRAVGPGVWTGWKGQLLRTLYYETEPMLTGGFSKISRKDEVKQAREALKAALADWPERQRRRVLGLHYDAYWLRVDAETQIRHATMVRQADQGGQTFAHAIVPMAFEGATEITVLTPDHPRLLTYIAGACSASEANIVDAQIFTTTDGQALDTIIVSRAFDTDEDEIRRAERIVKLIQSALKGEIRLPDAMARKVRKRGRREAFSVEPQASVSNDMSDRFSVIEVSCLDRVGLLYDLTRALAELNLDIASAHVATFGERARDSFYVTDLVGEKILNKARQGRIVDTLLATMAPAKRARAEEKAAGGTAASRNGRRDRATAKSKAVEAP